MMGRMVAFFTCALLLSFPVYPARRQGSEHRTGHYEGSALNTTANQRGKIVLDLYDFDPASGSVRAYCGFSDGLSGEAWLSGNIGGRGELELSGRLLDFRLVVHGRLAQDGTVKAAYRLEGASPQEGNFEVSFQSPLPSGQSARGFDDLIGAWEVGGGMPAQRNPVTGEASGISFTEARQLEVFPDGRFKHVLSHRHCEGTGRARCCSEQATLEQGKLSVEGSRLVFDIEGGGTITRDTCNPASLREGKVGRSRESFAWTLSPAAGGATLCLRNDSGGGACYQKQL